MTPRRNLYYGLVLVSIGALLFSGYVLSRKGSDLRGPALDTSTKPASNVETRGMQVQAAEEKIDRSSPSWMKQYCVSRIMEVGALPGAYERKRGPFIAMSPVYLSDRHVRYDDKVTCTLDYYIWPVREESFSSMGLEYAYSVRVWEKYYSGLTASISANLKPDGWKELVNKGDVGVIPDYSMSYRNTSENLREYLDVFYTNDEEVVYELLIIDL